MVGRRYFDWNPFAVSLTFLLLLGLPSIAAAQSTQGEIRGTMSDQSGGIIPGVQVTIKNLETGFTRNTVSDNNGFYSVPHLEPGNYQVLAELSGFKSFVRELVNLESDRVIRIDIALEIGQLSERVVVHTETPPVESETGRIADIIDNVSMRDVVVGTRGALAYFYLAPGAQVAGNTSYSMHGSRKGAGGFTMDGVNIGDPTTGGTFGPLNGDAEMLREVRVDSVNSNAEFGTAGTFSQTTSSGTNHLHGMAMWNHRNGVLNARTFFSTTRPPGLPDNWGFLSLGGPAVIPKLYNGHDRTFFFFHVNDEQSGSSSNSLFSVPTQAMRNGDFSAVGTIKDPVTGQPFGQNTIPSGRISQSAVKYMNRFYPQPTITTAKPSNNYNVLVPTSTNRLMVSGRLDQKLRDSNTLFFRYFKSFLDFNQLEGNLPPNILGYRFRQRATDSYVVSDTHIFSPKVINELRLGFHRIDWPLHAPLKGKDVVDLVGLTGYRAPLNPDEYGLPNVSLSGMLGITGTATTRNIVNSWNLADNVTFARGVHSFKTGVMLSFNKTSAFAASPSSQFGSFTFDGFATGQPFADFLLGIPRTASVASDVGTYWGSSTEWALFFQDDWKVLPRFTLNGGVRYERHDPWKEQGNRIYNFDPKTGSVVVPNSDVAAKIHPLFPKTIPVKTAAQAGFPSDTLIQTDSNDVAPRLGFAWRSGLWDLILRGGYGLYYTAQARVAFTGMVAGPFVATETFDNSITGGVPLWAWPQSVPSAQARALGTQDISATAANLKDSYVHQWNLSLEKQIGSYGVRLSYIGSSGIQLPFQQNINQPHASTTPFNQNLRPFPYVRNITVFETGATQSYNAFESELTRRVGKGLSLNASYTWAKNITDSSDQTVFGDTSEDAWNRARDRGNEEYTGRHRFTSYLTWDVPVGRDRAFLKDTHPLINGVLGGWRTSTYVAANSGYWYTPYYTGVDISGTNVTTGRPDRVCDGNLANPSVDRWFDSSCFKVPVAGSGRFGTSGRGIIQGPGWWGVSLGLFKYFSIKESLKFRLQGNFNNLFNHPQFFINTGKSDTAMNVSSANVGKINATNWARQSYIPDSRIIEVGVRLEW